VQGIKIASPEPNDEEGKRRGQTVKFLRRLGGAHAPEMGVTPVTSPTLGGGRHTSRREKRKVKRLQLGMGRNLKKISKLDTGGGKGSNRLLEEGHTRRLNPSCASWAWKAPRRKKPAGGSPYTLGPELPRKEGNAGLLVQIKKPGVEQETGDQREDAR